MKLTPATEGWEDLLAGQVAARPEEKESVGARLVFLVHDFFSM
jgi:hypothetical protein